MKRYSRLVFCLAVAGAAAVLLFGRRAGAASPAAEVSVVVNGKVPVDNLSFAELKKYALGDKQFWPNNVRVTLIIRAPGAPERKVVLDKVYGMTEAQFRQYWIAKVFRQEAAAGPKIVLTNQSAIELVNGIQGSLAFVLTSDVPKGVKVLKIDGKSPGEKGYPLQ